MVKIQETVFHCLKADDVKSFVQFILEYKSNILQNPYAMKDLYNFSMLDEGDWIVYVLTELDSEAIGCVSEFVSLAFDRYGNRKQMKISKKIQKKTSKASQLLSLVQTMFTFS